MIKRLFLALVSAIFLVLMIVACGSVKKESETTDTSDTETVSDTDSVDTGDTEVVPDSDSTDSGDTEAVPDEDNTDTGNITQDDCTIKSSFGTHSAKKNISDTCIQEIAKANAGSCTWDRQNENETSKHIAYLLRLVATFSKECTDKNEEEIVTCPDFIPETLRLESLSGCDVYNINPDSACDAPCADLYFSTNDDTFHTVFIGEIESYPSTIVYVKSSDTIKEASFIAEMHVGLNNALFTWSEKAEDGSIIEKEAAVKMNVFDSNSDIDDDFEAVDVGECRHEEPVFSFRDRIYTDGSYWCNEYVEVTDKTENSIRFNWFGEMHCGADWEYGYKVEGIEGNVLKVSILERDTDEIAVDCDNCCYLMPIEYTASTAEEIESVKTIEINYEGKNHRAYFEIK